MNQQVEKHTFSESLKVPLTESELKEIAEDLAKTLQTKSEQDGERKEVASQYKATIERLENKASEKARLIRNKYEYRQVDCEEVFDFMNQTVTVVRLDTGEVVRERAMTKAECQQNLDLDGEQ